MQERARKRLIKKLTPSSACHRPPKMSRTIQPRLQAQALVAPALVAPGLGSSRPWWLQPWWLQALVAPGPGGSGRGGSSLGGSGLGLRAGACRSSVPNARTGMCASEPSWLAKPIPKPYLNKRSRFGWSDSEGGIQAADATARGSEWCETAPHSPFSEGSGHSHPSEREGLVMKTSRKSAYQGWVKLLSRHQRSAETFQAATVIWLAVEVKPRGTFRTWVAASCLARKARGSANVAYCSCKRGPRCSCCRKVSPTMDVDPVHGCEHCYFISQLLWQRCRRTRWCQ